MKSTQPSSELEVFLHLKAVSHNISASSVSQTQGLACVVEEGETGNSTL